MSNSSPTAFLLWSILSALFLIFLVYHIWSYDKFQCVRWNGGRQPGAFKRIMTYSYLMTVPLLLIFATGLTVLKYKEGFVGTSATVATIIPKPVDIWQSGHRSMILPLFFVFSFAWALELLYIIPIPIPTCPAEHPDGFITHFEELAFWLFLLDQGPSKREWFTSWEYRMWYCGCVVAFLGMPLTALAARHDLDKIDAWIFLVGSLGSTVTNVTFVYVLIRFPAFLRHVKAEGAQPDVVVRLSTFFELNLIRVIFRFATGLSLLILASDGIRAIHPVNNSLFWSDFLLSIAAVGQIVSSTITLLIFFPRSLASEEGYQAKAPSASSHIGSTQLYTIPDEDHQIVSYAIDVQSFPTDASSPKSLAPTSLIQSPIHSPTPTPVPPGSQASTPVISSPTPFHTSTSGSHHDHDIRQVSAPRSPQYQDSPSISINELSDHGHVARHLRLVIGDANDHPDYVLREQNEDHDRDVDHDEPVPRYSAPYHEHAQLPAPYHFAGDHSQGRSGNAPVGQNSPHISNENGPTLSRTGPDGAFGTGGMVRRILREQRSAPMALSSRGGSPNVVQGPRIGIGLGAGSPQSQSASERAIGLAVRGPRPVGVRHGRGRSTSSLHPYVTNFRSPIDLVDTSPEATTPPYHQHVDPDSVQP